MTKHQFRQAGGGFFRTLTFTCLALVALALSVALAAPHTALAADTENYKSWTGKYGETVTLSRLAGENADETAAAISQEGFESSKCAIIARWDDFADALGASGLAGTLDCPILLTRLDKLSQATIDELKRLGTETVYVVGGTGAISEQIDADLDAIPTVKNHERIWGEYAWDTSLECAKAITEHGGNEQSEVIVTTSFNFQDALSISPYAYKYKVPLILEADSAQLTSDAISFINTTTGTIYVPGGNGAVPEKSVEGVFTDRVNNIVRLWGEDGYDTSNQIATYMTENNLLSASTVAIASGAQKAHGVDALAGAALIGKQGGVMLLANGNEAMEDVNYTTIDQEKDSQGSAAYLTTNQYEIKDAYVLGGTVVAPTAFFDKVYEILLWHSDKKELPANGWNFPDAIFTYTGKAHTPEVGAPDGLKEGTDYTVEYKDNINAGTATVIVTGIGNYTGTKTFPFMIIPRTLTDAELSSVSLDIPEGGYTYDGTEKKPGVSGMPEGFTEGTDYTVEYKDNKDARTATVIITGKGNYKGSTTRTFTINPKTVSIEWTPSEEATFTYDGNTHTPTVTVTGAVGNDELTVEIYYDGEDSQGNYYYNSLTPPSNIGAHTARINKIKAATADTDANNYALPITRLSKDFIIKEDTVGIGKYWLATAKASDPEDSTVVIKGQAQIDEDMKVLHGELSETSDGKNGEEVTNEYTNYMKGLSADGTQEQEVRLYTKWYGDTTDISGTEQNANKYVEFRILQVGEHDGDGSAVTFMATHSLPVSKQMINITYTSNDGSWEKSYMRTTVMVDYVAAGMKDIADVVLSLDKVTTSGSYGSWVQGSTTQDTFWLLSNSEVLGTGDNNTLIPTTYYEEGSQYAWFTFKGVNAKYGMYTANSLLGNIRLARSGYYPAGNGYVYWWLRSPDVASDMWFANFDNDGLSGNHDPKLNCGVAPAFAM